MDSNHLSLNVDALAIEIVTPTVHDGFISKFGGNGPS